MSAEKKAPDGKYRVVAVDIFDGTDWIHMDCDTKQQAIESANEKGGVMIKTHVYDDKGNHIHASGRF